MTELEKIIEEARINLLKYRSSGTTTDDYLNGIPFLEIELWMQKASQASREEAIHECKGKVAISESISEALGEIDLLLAPNGE